MSDVHPMVQAEREACARYLRARIEQCKERFKHAVARGSMRKQLLGAMQELERAAEGIEKGETEAHFGVNDEGSAPMGLGAQP